MKTCWGSGCHESIILKTVTIVSTLLFEIFSASPLGRRSFGINSR
jgi:hypothetical protein